MKKFFKEFKDFITRGNVLDMAVGIIVGGAFTAIITALVSGILTPLLHLIPGSDGSAALQLVLREPQLAKDGVTVIKEAVILDFGALISAIVSFIITAFVLFLIVKMINSVRAGGAKISKKMKKKKGVVEEPVAEEPAPAPTVEELLTQIRDLLAKANISLDTADVSETTDDAVVTAADEAK